MVKPVEQALSGRLRLDLNGAQQLDLLLLAKHVYEQQQLGTSRSLAASFHTHQAGQGDYQDELSNEKSKQDADSIGERPVDLEIHTQLIHSNTPETGSIILSRLGGQAHGQDNSNAVLNFLKLFDNLPDRWTLHSGNPPVEAVQNADANSRWSIGDPTALFHNSIALDGRPEISTCHSRSEQGHVVDVNDSTATGSQAEETAFNNFPEPSIVTASASESLVSTITTSSVEVSSSPAITQALDLPPVEDRPIQTSNVSLGSILPISEVLSGTVFAANTVPELAVTFTSVTAVAADDAPGISGALASQTTTDAATLQPFAAVQINDPDVGKIETITVTLDQPGNGALANLGTGSYDAVHGVYTASGSAAQVTADLQGLTFVPTAHEVAPGQNVTTGLAISVSDGLGGTATDTTTSVTAVAADDAPGISQSHLGRSELQGVIYNTNEIKYREVSLPEPASLHSQLRTVVLSLSGETVNAHWDDARLVHSSDSQYQTDVERQSHFGRVDPHLSHVGEYHSLIDHGIHGH